MQAIHASTHASISPTSLIQHYFKVQQAQNTCQSNFIGIHISPYNQEVTVHSREIDSCRLHTHQYTHQYLWQSSINVGGTRLKAAVTNATSRNPPSDRMRRPVNVPRHVRDPPVHWKARRLLDFFIGKVATISTTSLI